MISRSVTCSVLVGRREELCVLNDGRKGLAQSRGTAILISGEAGIGKSRLLTEFLKAAAEGRARNVASAQCLEVARRPFGPIREWLGALTPRRPREHSPAIREALAHIVPELIADAPDRKLEKADVFAALAAYLRATADERATILSIEDLHWADASTLEFIAFLTTRLAGARLMLVATYRSEETGTNDALASAVTRMLREPVVHRIELQGLAPREVRELLERALEGHPPLSHAALADVSARSEGNPFFAEELLRSALEHRDAHSPPGLPLSIRTGILERFATLSDEERRIITGAAVLGYRFEPRVLAQTVGCELRSVLAAVRRARNLNLIVDDGATPAPFRFRHAITQQTIYGDQLSFDARLTHERILQIVETANGAETNLDQLAYHAWAAKNDAKTLKYNERAGEAAIRMHGVAEARTYFDRALRVASNAEDQARLLERVGAVAVMQGRSADALDAFEAAL
ncbi:MAG: AAA family ATPase, partial [Candidatus Eremiobacteraeota bacterium]|nr:AAA family ATPase [Candidatus Eremiobacteraeota bacterium]